MITTRNEYKFITPPASDVVINGNILPVRDARDDGTWKEIHGEDLYFVYEGAYERYLAKEQFNNRNQYDPYIYSRMNIPKGDIRGERYVATIDMISDCFNNGFIDKDTTLKEIYDTKLDGTPIVDIEVVPLDEVIGRPTGMMSDSTNFEKGKPLYADHTRAIYLDETKLKKYVAYPRYLNPGDANDTYHSVVNATQWSQEKGSSGVRPSMLSNYMTSAHGGDMWSASQGFFNLPCCGKEGGEINPILGQAKKLYGRFQVDAYKDGEQKTVFGYVSINIPPPMNAVYNLTAQQVVDAGKQLCAKHNLFPTQDDDNCLIRCWGFVLVCELTDRTII